jgi:hypothetical protein
MTIGTDPSGRATLPTGGSNVSAAAVAATCSLLVAGLSLAAYALTGFTTRDWTVAAPALLVAAAGLAGLRNRWFYLAGLVPLGAVLSVAGSILAFDLARPDETPYLLGTIAIIVGACGAATLGPYAALRPRAPELAVIALIAVAAIPLVGWYVVATNPDSGNNAPGLTATERASAIDVEMIDYAFVVDPTLVEPGRVLHLRNTGSLPHDFTSADLDIAAYVPPGRDAYLRLPSSTASSFTVICTVGDHADLGMRLDLDTTDS